eukprot:Phypoly_transcript_13010.p1 GENE.Phypoly_transcript_13010~~Phypoly_transcript_13010.p1  ORF type:complete len:266 (+),score=22.69 Phypoly_transcript_13010:31-828(+)
MTEKNRSFIFAPFADYGIGVVSTGLARIFATPYRNSGQSIVMVDNVNNRYYHALIIHPKKVLATQGIHAWSSQDLITKVPAKAMSFVLKDVTERLLSPLPSDTHTLTRFGLNFLCGSMGGTLPLVTRMSLLTIRGQTSTFGPPDNARFIRNATYLGLYFGVYDTFKPTVLGSHQNSFFASLLFAWATTTFCQFATRPFHSSYLYYEKPYQQTFMDKVRTEGFFSLWKESPGKVVPRSIAGALALALYDKLHVLFYGKCFNGCGNH